MHFLKRITNTAQSVQREAQIEPYRVIPDHSEHTHKIRKFIEIQYLQEGKTHTGQETESPNKQERASGGNHKLKSSLMPKSCM